VKERFWGGEDAESSGPKQKVALVIHFFDSVFDHWANPNI
jgi:hypothetical protein